MFSDKAQVSGVYVLLFPFGVFGIEDLVETRRKRRKLKMSKKNNNIVNV